MKTAVRTLFVLGLLAIVAAETDFIKKSAAPEEQHLSENGKKLIWAGFFGMAVPAAYSASTVSATKDGERYYHILSAFICMIASLAYLAMATGNGVYVREFDGREFFYGRYIDWFFTTPLQLLDLFGLAGASSDTQNLMVGCDILMIVSGLIGAFFEGQEKYYFWGFGMIMFLPILSQLNSCKGTCPANTSATYNKIANLTIITWIFYPIVWLMAEGNNSLAPDKEALAYTTLDILAKSVFGFIIISARAPAAAAPAAAPASAPEAGSML